jgi:molybdopterin-guanine dinucleotide biosynthesis protein A
VSGVLGVLVAGGQGRRLSRSTPKALVRLAGLTLLERAWAVLGAVCDERVVVAPAALALPVPGADRVTDAPGAEGPLAGLVAGLGARSFERAVVLGVDFPLMRPAALAALRDQLAGEVALLPAPGGIPQPLAAVYGPAASGVLARALARGERAPSVAVAALRPRLFDDAEIARLPGGLENFFNLNTPEDLAEAARRLDAAGSRAPA